MSTRTIGEVAKDVISQAAFMLRVADAEKWPQSDLTRVLANDARALAMEILQMSDDITDEEVQAR